MATDDLEERERELQSTTTEDSSASDGQVEGHSPFGGLTEATETHTRASTPLGKDERGDGVEGLDVEGLDVSVSPVLGRPLPTSNPVFLPSERNAQRAARAANHRIVYSFEEDMEPPVEITKTI